MTTRGMALNNPCNLMHSPSIKWLGEVVPTSDPQGRLCQFDTLVDGIRAAAKNLLSYYHTDGCRSIADIINRYAPPSENPTKDYIKFIAMQCGVDPTSSVDLTSPTFLRLLISGIIRFEQGTWAGVPYDVLIQGVAEALN